MPINSPIDLIDSDILDIPDGSVGEIKRAATKLGIDPQNKYESELRDEIAQEYGFYQNTNEMTDDEFSKAKEADRLEKHPEKDKIKKVQQLIRKQIKELWLKK